MKILLVSVLTIFCLLGLTLVAEAGDGYGGSMSSWGSGYGGGYGGYSYVPYYGGYGYGAGSGGAGNGGFCKLFINILNT